MYQHNLYYALYAGKVVVDGVVHQKYDAKPRKYCPRKYVDPTKASGPKLKVIF
jgi:hypothetical protein